MLSATVWSPTVHTCAALLDTLVDGLHAPLTIAIFLYVLHSQITAPHISFSHKNATFRIRHIDTN